MDRSNKKIFFLLAIFFVFLAAAGSFLYLKKQKSPDSLQKNQTVQDNNGTYPTRKNITVTVFWVGEHAGRANDYITNTQSAWDGKWEKHFGGTDDPKNRNGYFPIGFTPRENPFYFALPYNDFNDDGSRKTEAYDVVYWATQKNWNDSESMLKNRWIKITKGGKTAYAQWEDVGPMGEDDAAYVFGSASPENTENKNAGLDVSPAVSDYLNLSGIDKIDWQFVDQADVPDGPWKKIITTSQINP